MGRYLYTSIKNGSTGTRSFKTTLYPKIDILDSDIFTISRRGDRLDLLAFKYYGDVSMWWIIALANDVEDGNMVLKAGINLRIPTDTGKIMADLEKLNDGA